MPTARILLVGTLLALAADTVAAPIRVGILKGTAPNRYWHTSMHAGADAIVAILANPGGANLNNPVIPPQGFSVRVFGPDSMQCSGSGCGPTSEQKNDFINALDSLDVVVVVNFVEFGQAFSAGNNNHRTRLIEFWSTKGLVSLHQSNDQFGTWADWGELNAARFQNHPTSERAATLHLENVGSERAQLNAGLPDTLRLSEEWFSFTTSGFSIRGHAYLQVHMTIDENSYEGGMGGARVMGDHPMAWSREFPEGGRFFYTALGHKTSTYDSVYFFRRQLYNAVLWASGYEVSTAIQARGTEVSGGSFGDHARVNLSGGTLTVSLLHNGAHTIEILTLDGRRIDSRRSAARTDHTFANLRPGVHLVAVTSPAGRATRLVTIP